LTGSNHGDSNQTIPAPDPDLQIRRKWMDRRPSIFFGLSLFLTGL